MNTLKLLKKYYSQNEKALSYLLIHSESVTGKALEIAAKNMHWKPDIRFISEAAMLHDMGVFLCYAPQIGCFGKNPYIAHGYLGRELLEKEGYPLHALVCERHVGTGLSIADIRKQKLPLPERNMLPLSIEEKIICLADKFFSKSSKNLRQEKSYEEIISSLSKHGKEKADAFIRLYNDLILHT
jgi:uncharacterized protein